VARPRKTSEKRSAGTADAQDKDAIEDAVILDETGDPADRDPDAVVEETSQELSPEIGTTPGTPEDLAARPGDDAQPETAEQEPDPEPAPEPPHDSGLGSVPEPASEPVAEATEDDLRGNEPPRREETAPAAPPAAPPAGSGAARVLPLLFGGVIAALVGFAASRFILPEGWGDRGETEAALAEIRSAAETQTARIAELDAALTALRDEVAAVPDPASFATELQQDLGGRIAEVAAAASQATERLGSVDSRLADLAARIEEIALRPIPEGLDTASLDAELSQFRDELSAAVDAARAEIVNAQEEAAVIAARASEDAAAQEAAAAEAAEDLRAAAEAAAATAAREAAKSRILAALESGEPYDGDLSALDGVEIPEALSAPAADGVPTLAGLAEAFPDAARAALDASIRSEAGETAADRLTAFLRVQTGARSLEPRDGDDPDAVLSRAEAALGTGDLQTALAELAALPEAGQAELAGWMQAARTRLDAVDAAQSLSQD
jgi:hypothetical protein